MDAISERACIVEATGLDDAAGTIAARAAVSRSGSGSGGSGGNGGGSSNNGRIITLSATGLVLASSDSSVWVLAPASLLVPFRRSSSNAHDNHGPPPSPRAQPATLPPPLPPMQQPPTDGAALSVRLARSSGAALPARVLAALPCRGAALQAAAALRDLNGGGDAWRVGWWLEGGNSSSSSSNTNGSKTNTTPIISSAESRNEAGAALIANWLLLEVATTGAAAAAAQRRAWGPPACRCAPPAPRPGRGVRIFGSPFGCLAPHHFAGTVVAGCVSNVLPPARGYTSGSSSNSSSSDSGVGRSALFLVDAAAYPGMEGSPVCCTSCGGSLGVLAPPLTGAEQHSEVHVAVAAPHLLPLARAALERCVGPAATAALAAPARAAAPATAQLSSSGSGGLSTPELWARQLVASPARAALPATAPPPPPAEGDALARALAGVVLLRVAGSWATGVAAGDGRIVITNAHLLPAANSGGGANNRSGSSTGAGTIWARVGGGNGSGGGAARWVRASLLRRFSGYLDVAVVILDLPPRLPALGSGSGSSGSGSSASISAAGLLPTPLQLAPIKGPGAPREGEPVFVAGHGLFGPRVGWPPSVTRGSLARCVALPSSTATATAAAGASSTPPPRASMLVVTAAVHAGASGGALVDAAGRLVGLVTSNTRHHRGATLPRWSYAIAAAELAPVWGWAARFSGAGAGGSGGGAASSSLAALARVDADDAAGHRLWALKPPLEELPPRSKL